SILPSSFSSYYLAFCFFCSLFFFSSRRRHTRSKRDWSSDVCSSDLFALSVANGGPINANRLGDIVVFNGVGGRPGDSLATAYDEIGRASCSERVEMLAVAAVPQCATFSIIHLDSAATIAQAFTVCRA